MVFKKVDDGFVVRLDRGEELVETLTKFVKDQTVTGGFIQGLGGAVKAELGYYNLERKKYVFKNVKGVVELVSLHGNAAMVGDEPVLHLHAVVTDRNNKARGGHVKSLVAGGTCEVYIRKFSEPLQRKPDPEVGLPLLDL